MLSGFQRTSGIIQKGLDQGLHLGGQLYVWQDGQTRCDAAFGQASAEAAMRPDTRMLWLSAGKPLAAVAIAQLWERGSLCLDDPVAKHIPPFAANGKEVITVRHLLTHTAGIRGVAPDWRTTDWKGLINAICAARPEADWRPGRRAGYHRYASWYLLAELVKRLDGRGYAEYLRDEVLRPLRMERSFAGGLPGAEGMETGRLFDTEGGRASPWSGDLPERRSMPIPGGGVYGPIHELGRFYRALLQGGRLEGARILTEQTVEALTARHRCGLRDETFMQVYDWGLGFMADSKVHGAKRLAYDFGAYSSPRAFGHGGAQSSSGFCDPERRLVVAWLMNGRPGEAKHMRRNHALNGAIYEDLGLGAA
jgi:CubicO group peptidase (beta-lactamase class C family)